MPQPAARARSVLASALLFTMLAGLSMRWLLAGYPSFPIDFHYVRHAHSHLGYYGVLVPLCWLVWRGRGLPLAAPVVLWTYAGAVVLATLGFLRAGYGPEAIVGSTVVGAVWLYLAWKLRDRMLDGWDPLGAVPIGMVLSLACVPPIALNVRRAPDVGQAWVATFLAALLFLVVIPSTLAQLERRLPWLVLLVSGSLGALSLGVGSSAVLRVGLALFGLLLLAGRRSLPLWQWLVWGTLGGGIVLMAVGVVPNNRPVVIGAVHFMVLGACLPVLLQRVSVSSQSRWWWTYELGVALLCVPLVLQGLGAGAWTALASAWGGSVVVVHALGAVLVWAWQAQRTEQGSGEPAALR